MNPFVSFFTTGSEASTASATGFATGAGVSFLGREIRVPSPKLTTFFAWSGFFSIFGLLTFYGVFDN